MKSFSLYGKDLFGNSIKPPSKGVIADNFTLSPFSVLNAREGIWQSRKKRWLARGIEGEIGRDAKSYNSQEWVVKAGIKGNCIKQTGTSIFDPVLCELMYIWFCPKGGQIVDPFAGGSVRGLVAHLLDYKYWGCDLSEKQIKANHIQAKEITPENKPIWVHGDAMKELIAAPKADFIFSCPPYGDLEVYSDGKEDLSTMPHNEFISAMEKIVYRCYTALNDNRFACFVVGDFRDKKGFYRNFVSDTISCFLKAGFQLYNEIILVTSVGSLPIRITKQFNASRKIGKTHQNILVFIKGDPKIATSEIKQKKENTNNVRNNK